MFFWKLGNLGLTTPIKNSNTFDVFRVNCLLPFARKFSGKKTEQGTVDEFFLRCAEGTTGNEVCQLRAVCVVFTWCQKVLARQNLLVWQLAVCCREVLPSRHPKFLECDCWLQLSRLDCPFSWLAGIKKKNLFSATFVTPLNTINHYMNLQYQEI